MIIETTFNDNDCTEILANYWSNFWFKNYARAIKRIQDPKEYKEKNIEAESLLQKAFYNEDMMTPEEVEKFLHIVRESIIDYIIIFHRNRYKFLVENLEVARRTVISDKNQNGEVLYYFLGIKKYLIF